MKYIKYLLKRIAYGLTRTIVGAICLLAKLGIGKSACTQFRACVDHGAGAGAYIRGNYEKCYEILSPYLEVQDDDIYGGIKYQLALLFYYGRGVKLNRPMANKLFEESAALGWDNAQEYLSQFDGPYKTKT